ncbi:glucose dehydrogenase, partial [Amycolatopsis sp. NPDC000673]
MRTRYRWSAPLALLACGGLVLSGCARFDDTAAGQTFTPAPVPSPESPPQVQEHGDG